MSDNQEREEQDGSADVDWGYSDGIGPDNWANLSPKFGICDAGKNQSPIDISSTRRAELPSLTFDYDTKAESIHRKKTQVMIPVLEGGSLKIDGETFELKQFHFHTPAEHKIDGEEFPLELHLVHQNADGEMAVVAVLFESGNSHDGIYRVLNYMPASMGDQRNLETADVKPAELLPRNHGYYRYNGSLTTPPCAEGVRWIVMKETPSVSGSQIDSFKRAVREPNARPVQPVNARVILE